MSADGQPVRSDDEARDKISEQQRLPRHLGNHGDQPGCNDADGDIGDKSVLHDNEN